MGSRRVRLGRGWEHRVSMLKTMVTQLIEHERIETTLPRAKELAKMADKCISLAKQGTWQAKSRAAGIVRTEKDVHKLFTLMADRYRDREGGYTRVIKTRFRQGDAAPMAMIEFIDRPGELRAARPARKQINPWLSPAARAAVDET